MPKVSILMLTYNRPQQIGRAIASVRAQTFQDWELIIVQDGSNPETRVLLAEWLARDPRIRYFPRGKTGSIAEASNFGLEQARGEYVAILDDDDEWIVAEKLARQIEFLDAHPDYAGCGGGYVVVDEHGCERARFLKPETDDAIRERALLANPMANSTTVFRRAIGGEAAVYDTAIRQFADWDFWLTVGAKGKLYNFPDFLAHYALWEGGSSFRNLKANGRAAITIVRKHRREYRGYAPALILAWGHFLYGCLPAGVRRVTYNRLSAFKKRRAATSQSL
jgi:glycosyltransferase involved in cell wall biosynthesis